jgi:hypothetical protein
MNKSSGFGQDDIPAFQKSEHSVLKVMIGHNGRALLDSQAETGFKRG